MTPSKRIFDVALALALLIPLGLAIVVIAIVILVVDGRPVFYRSERMRDPKHSFMLLKFRTMRAVEDDSGVSGGDKQSRITTTGRFLRNTRLDELPQLFNILAGDLSFVGPRPPLRVYVEAFPALYEKVLQSRPGVTGLASLIFHRHEERLLSACTTAEDTDRVYRRLCVPRKARLDMIYQRRQSICLDTAILIKTLLSVGKQH